jgi:hypothetical protein
VNERTAGIDRTLALTGIAALKSSLDGTEALWGAQPASFKRVS